MADQDPPDATTGTMATTTTIEEGQTHTTPGKQRL
jgi:hypothetical protein